MSENATSTVAVTKKTLKRLHAARKYPEEPLHRVVDRALDALSGPELTTPKRESASLSMGAPA